MDLLNKEEALDLFTDYLKDTISEHVEGYESENGYREQIAKLLISNQEFKHVSFEENIDSNGWVPYNFIGINFGDIDTNEQFNYIEQLGEEFENLIFTSTSGGYCPQGLIGLYSGNYETTEQRRSSEMGPYYEHIGRYLTVDYTKVTALSTSYFDELFPQPELADGGEAGYLRDDIMEATEDFVLASVGYFLIDGVISIDSDLVKELKELDTNYESLQSDFDSLGEEDINENEDEEYFNDSDYVTDDDLQEYEDRIVNGPNFD